LSKQSNADDYMELSAEGEPPSMFSLSCFICDKVLDFNYDLA
jgi:hypothetical protein